MFRINKKKLAFVYLFLILLLIYSPIISLIIFSFNESKGRISSLVHFNKFGLKWYYRILEDSAIKSSIFITFQIAFLSTIISTIIGTLAAFSLINYKKKWRQIIINFNQFSIIIPEIIHALALFVLFNSIGLKNSFWRMLLSHISFSTPYVLISVYTKCLTLETDLIEAAYDLGATSFQTLTKIILPQLKDVILVSAGIAFALSFDDFIISYFAGGSDYQNISAYIYSLKGTINPTINALSSVLILIVLFKIIIGLMKSRKDLKRK
ncbi:ABC transporter permease [Candidatus Phytoplasma fraxini]|uniref:Spermidine/putrescine import ABC transporter permease protein PotC n=1 Tax=Ash yellows phytoplasma TaxID=35780 RepID=A0ABZ2U8C2_ASHYP